MHQNSSCTYASGCMSCMIFVFGILDMRSGMSFGLTLFGVLCPSGFSSIFFGSGTGTVLLITCFCFAECVQTMKQYDITKLSFISIREVYVRDLCVGYYSSRESWAGGRWELKAGGRQAQARHHGANVSILSRLVCQWEWPTNLMFTIISNLSFSERICIVVKLMQLLSSIFNDLKVNNYALFFLSVIF